MKLDLIYLVPSMFHGGPSIPIGLNLFHTFVYHIPLIHSELCYRVS